MPSATEELRKEWSDEDGSPTEVKAYCYLKDRNWKHNRGVWSKPHSSYSPSTLEWSALHFLVQEWDEAFE